MSQASDQSFLNAQWNAASAQLAAADAQAAPHALMRPRLYLDGNMYCALYGDDIMSGCAGFGETAAAAMAAFDAAWTGTKAPTPRTL